VVKLNLYLVDATHLPVVREVRDEYVNTQQPPASTAVEVRRLVRADLLIEVEAVAVIASFQPMTSTGGLLQRLGQRLAASEQLVDLGADALGGR
jgi:endoribonuclease L-PSP